MKTLNDSEGCYYPFCREHGLNGRNICEVLQGKQKHHKGWTGKYL